MDLQERIDLLVRLGEYFKKNDENWQEVKLRAFHKNGWFLEEFIQHSAEEIANNYLQRDQLNAWVAYYHINDNIQPKNIGIVMAGNIPLVGFHDFLAVFISGHQQTIKLSSKDEVLLPHIFSYLYGLNHEFQNVVSVAEILKGCDAYIATGGNNTGRYFEQYFGKYPNIIRKNKTSIAVLSGNESKEELSELADDIHLYFGLGCRNVTKIYVPSNYDFVPMLDAFRKYSYFADHHKYKNNFDYQLSILLLNHKYYMTNDSILLLEESGIFSPVSQLNFEFYHGATPKEEFKNNDDIQCIVGVGGIPFGEAQKPNLFTYADGIDTMQFLLSL